MKKYFFSFRLVLADCCSIIVLGFTSSLYPILFYNISSFYQLIGIIFMTFIILANAGIVYILVNVIRKEIKERKKDTKKKEVINTDTSLREMVNKKRSAMELEEKVDEIGISCLCSS